MPSSVCKLHLSHIRRAVAYPPCEFRAVLTDRPRHYKSGASLDRRRGPPRLRPDRRRGPRFVRVCSFVFFPVRSQLFAGCSVFCSVGRTCFFRIVRRGRRAGWNPHIFYFWPFFQRLRKSAMNTRAVTQENACARAREIFAPRFPKNFPKNFRVSFSRFVFSASRNLRYEHPHGSREKYILRTR